MSADLCTCSPCSVHGSPALYRPLVDVEEILVATIIDNPALLDAVPLLESYDFDLLKVRTIFDAVRNLQHRCEDITAESIDAYLGEVDIVRGTVCRLHAGRRYMRALRSINPVPDVARDAAHVRGWASLLRKRRQDREDAIAAADLELRKQKFAALFAETTEQTP